MTISSKGWMVEISITPGRRSEAKNIVRVIMNDLVNEIGPCRTHIRASIASVDLKYTAFYDNKKIETHC